MIILIYIAYYFISIMPIIIAYRFRKYTISDFQYNKKLKWQRRIMLVLSYIVAFFEAFIAGQRKTIHSYSSDFELLIISSGVFICIYIFSIGWLESPKEYIKKKKNGNNNEFNEVSFPPLTTVALLYKKLDNI